MKIKKSLVTQFLQEYRIVKEGFETYLPASGDVAMFEIVEIGKHQSMQSDSKRSVSIFSGDYILAAFADRYATSQFEGYVPTEILPEYHILGAGGVIGVVKSKNAALEDIEPTTVKWLGYAVDDSNQIINTKFYRMNRPRFKGDKKGPKVILSLGATMDSGKTTTAAFLTRGLYLEGKKVGFIKLTGTAFTKDKDFVFDTGAIFTLDFSDAGYPSTFTIPVPEILDIYEFLRNKMIDFGGLDYIVMEIADGILQRETMGLITNKDFMNTISHVVFSCGDSLSALKGLEVLQSLQIKPDLLSGRFTMSELLIREVRQFVDMPVFSIDHLEQKAANALFQ
ncbi:MAG: hypothetical protein KGP35_02135 [Bacteroidetes bacterium]|nr:hypothetical protein [Bacteroidota bacterium]